MKNLKIKVTQEMVNYVQRLGMEVDTRTYIIDRMFENHKNDTDDSVFQSVPFKKYSEELAKVKAEYDMAVKTLGDKLIPMVEKIVGHRDITFNWTISNFNDLEVDIELLEELNA